MRWRAMLKSRHVPALLLLLLMLVLSLSMGRSLLAPSAYDSYTRQALAWRQGMTHLPRDVPHLELAIREGRYFVSFPPVPSVPLFLLSFLFGAHPPDGMLVKACGLAAFYAFSRALRRSGWAEWKAGWMSFFLLASSSLLPMLLSGAVWYQAQVMGLMFVALAIDRLRADRPVPGLFCYALAVGCRPFDALYGPLLMLLFLQRRQKEGDSIVKGIKALLPGIALGLMIAVAYGWYNWIRFGSIFEFGHNYLPEFSFQGGTQFSLAHIPGNIRSFVLGLPFEQGEGGLQLKKFGFSLFLANPILLFLMLWTLRDTVKRELSLIRLLIPVFFLLQLTLLLMHRTFGGFQFGARYAVDLIPYAALYLMGMKKEQRLRLPLLAVMILSLAFSIYGSLMIQLPG